MTPPSEFVRKFIQVWGDSRPLVCSCNPYHQVSPSDVVQKLSPCWPRPFTKMSSIPCSQSWIKIIVLFNLKISPQENFCNYLTFTTELLQDATS